MEYALLIGAIVAFVAVAWYLSDRFEQERTREYEAAARKLGLEFYPNGDRSLVDPRGQPSTGLGDFSLFQFGHGRKLRNLIRGRTDNVDVAIFDYSYTTGGGESSSTQRQTVIRFDSVWLNLPRFELRPVQMSDRLGKLFGSRNITLSEFPAFSKKSLLRGEAEPEIREVFTPEVVLHLESLPGLHIAGEGSKLILYRHAKRLRGYELRGFLEEAFSVYAEFKNRNPSPMT